MKYEMKEQPHWKPHIQLWILSMFWKANGSSAGQKILCFCGTGNSLS